MATAPGRAGIGILRASGEKARDISLALAGFVPSPRVATTAIFRDGTGASIDRGLVLYFPAPHSYTGEDVVEFHCHGSPATLTALLSAATSREARLARPGEFTERAFLNGKIDLAQAEAVADLISAGSQRAARAAMRTLSGDLSKIVDDLSYQLTDIRSRVEASLDFPDELDAPENRIDVEEALARLLETIENLQGVAQRGAKLAQGMRIAIVGPPNVGKSTLLNRLLRDDRALVSDIAGTTRDVVQGDIDLSGIPVSFADTAGLRETLDPIELQGIARTLIAISRADAVLLVCDQEFFPERLIEEIQSKLSPGARLVKVINKADLLDPGDRAKLERDQNDAIALSALTGEGVDKLETALLSLLGVAEVEDGEFLARERHLQGLARAREALVAAKHRSREKPFAIELFAEELRIAQHALESLLGKVDAETILDSIFSRFCIGK